MCKMSVNEKVWEQHKTDHEGKEDESTSETVIKCIFFNEKFANTV